MEYTKGFSYCFFCGMILSCEEFSEDKEEYVRRSSYHNAKIMLIIYFVIVILSLGINNFFGNLGRGLNGSNRGYYLKDYIKNFTGALIFGFIPLVISTFLAFRSKNRSMIIICVILIILTLLSLLI